mmetsp:Transcript_92274/g.162777  ORF Transcript_92274/g.162777 Transcript_92274/m.162777 type:complete len:219 (-) Transcript_92274:136-792(-)
MMAVHCGVRLVAFLVTMARPGQSITCSSNTCSDLGWAPRNIGGSSLPVCGGTEIDGQCPGKKSWSDAVTFCEALGARLCTCVDLYVHESARGSGCISDMELAWTSTSCGEGSYYAAKSNAQPAPSDVECKTATETMDVRCCADSILSAAGCGASQNPLFSQLNARAAYCGWPYPTTTKQEQQQQSPATTSSAQASITERPAVLSTIVGITMLVGASLV